jgi:Tfp pilus assembly pilus retraction ATPase PilT
MSYQMNDLLELVCEENASDLHLHVGQPPTLRLSGSMTPIDGPPLTPQDTEALMMSIAPDVHQRAGMSDRSRDDRGAARQSCLSIRFRTARRRRSRRDIPLAMQR